MVKGILNRTVNVLSESYKSIEERDEEKLLSGSIMIELKRSLWESDKPFMPDTWDEFGFKIFSQSNEDGLIQYLIRKIDIPNKVFIEFGCSNYRECNTRFLLMHDYWDGFVMDGSEDNIKSIVDSSIYWKHNLTAVSAFITKENINELLMKSGFLEDIGILSIDIDGNDYWVWNEIDCINPRIIICEYNPIFGSKCCVSVPYKEDFYRTEAHYSNLYWGASLGAYVHLAKKKGYRLVCINQMAHNAFFVRNDVGLCLEEVSVDQAYRTPKYRDSRNENGELTYLGQKEGIELIKEMPVVDVLSGQERTIKECLNECI